MDAFENLLSWGVPVLIAGLAYIWWTDKGRAQPFLVGVSYGTVGFTLLALVVTIAYKDGQREQYSSDYKVVSTWEESSARKISRTMINSRVALRDDKDLSKQLDEAIAITEPSVEQSKTELVSAKSFAMLIGLAICAGFFMMAPSGSTKGNLEAATDDESSDHGRPDPP